MEWRILGTDIKKSCNARNVEVHEKTTDDRLLCRFEFPGEETSFG